ncbi:unnamed protein product, partial [Polarella glacialis]
MSTGSASAARTAVGRELALQLLPSPAAVLLKWLLLHPWVGLLGRNKRRLLASLLGLLFVRRFLRRGRPSSALALPLQGAEAPREAEGAEASAARPEPPQSQARPSSPLPSVLEILSGQGGKPVGGFELLVSAALCAAGSLVLVKKAELLGLIIARQNDRGLSRRWLVAALQYPLLCVLSTAFYDAAGLMRSRLALKWRRNVTAKLHDLYFTRMRYYRILNESEDVRIPDPDIRICKDVASLTDALASLMISVVNAAVSIVMFSSATVSYRHWSWSLASPGLFLLGLTCIMASEPATRQNVFGALATVEGRFSQTLTRLQLHAQRVFMLQGETFELDQMSGLVEEIRSKSRHKTQIIQFREGVENLFFRTTSASCFLELVANLSCSCMMANDVAKRAAAEGSSLPLDPSVARPWVADEMAIGMRDLHGFYNTCMGMSAAIGALISLQSFGHVTLRVQQLFARLNDLEHGHLDGQESSVFSDEGSVVRFEAVTIQTPTKQVLLEDLSFRVEEGQSLLICGHNGAGKSSIVRCLCNLWPVAAGRIARPGGASQAEESAELNNEIYYLPQKPCNVLGSLSDQLTYPQRFQDGLPEDELRRWLRYVDLEYLVDRTLGSSSISRVVGVSESKDVDWEVLLSMGEQQALSIARLLYHHPRFAILDECTSAVGKVLERRLFEAARELGISCITITHRPALKEHHAQLLQLTGQPQQHQQQQRQYQQQQQHQPQQQQQQQQQPQQQQQQQQQQQPQPPCVAEGGPGWQLTDLPSPDGGLPARKPRCKDAAEVHRRMEAYLAAEKSVRRPVVSSSLPAVPDQDTERDFLAKRSAKYQGQSPSGWRACAADVVKKRWPSSASRLWAVLSLGLHTAAERRSALCQLAVMLILVRLRVNLFWRWWRSMTSMMLAGMCGDLALVLAECMTNVFMTGACSLVDQLFRRQGSLLMEDLWASATHRLQRRVLGSGGALLSLGSSGGASSGGIENPVLRLAELREIFGAVLGQLNEVVMPLAQGISFLPSMVRGIGAMSPVMLIANFLCFRGAQLLAPNFPALQARTTELESKFQVLHTRLRTIAEAVAFSGGGSAERRIVEPHLEAVLEHREKSARREVFYNMMVNFFTDYRQLPIWTQRLASVRFAQLNNPLGADGVSPETVISNFLFDRSVQYPQVATQKLVRLAEALSRVDGQCIRCLELIADDVADELVETLEASAKEGALRLKVASLDLVTQRGICLAKDIHFEVEAGMPMVITGPNATGKSLLGSVLLGLYPALGEGCEVQAGSSSSSTRRPSLRTIMPAPQQIYLPLGVLFRQVTYPTSPGPLSPPFECSVELPGAVSEEEVLAHFRPLGAETCRTLLETFGTEDGVAETGGGTGASVVVTFGSLDGLLAALGRPQDRRLTTAAGQTLDLECDLHGSPLSLRRARACLRAVGVEHLLLREP